MPRNDPSLRKKETILVYPCFLAMLVLAGSLIAVR